MRPTQCRREHITLNDDLSVVLWTILVVFRDLERISVSESLSAPWRSAPRDRAAFDGFGVHQARQRAAPLPAVPSATPTAAGGFGFRVRASDAAVTGAPSLPAPAATCERTPSASNATAAPSVAGTCERRTAAWVEHVERPRAPRARPRRAPAPLRDVCEPTLAACTARRVLLPLMLDDDAAGARGSWPGRLVQSPQPLQTLAAPAFQAGHGVPGNSARRDPRRDFDLTPES